MKLFKKYFGLFLAICLSGVLFSCGEDGNIIIEVSFGLKPIISWEGGAVYSLSVDDISDKEIAHRVWECRVKGLKSVIYSPVIYGIYEDSTDIVISESFQYPDSLIEGRDYSVTVLGSREGLGAGYCEFVAVKEDSVGNK